MLLLGSGMLAWVVLLWVGMSKTPHKHKYVKLVRGGTVKMCKCGKTLFAYSGVK